MARVVGSVAFPDVAAVSVEAERARIAERVPEHVKGRAEHVLRRERSVGHDDPRQEQHLASILVRQPEEALAADEIMIADPEKRKEEIEGRLEPELAQG